MAKFVEIIAKMMAGGLLLGGALMLLSIICALLGAFSGWVASILMPIWVTSGLALIGVKVSPDQLYLLGAGLGWFGSFFRATAARSESKS
jgi:hypothetical protein